MATNDERRMSLRFTCGVLLSCLMTLFMKAFLSTQFDTTAALGIYAAVIMVNNEKCQRLTLIFGRIRSPVKTYLSALWFGKVFCDQLGRWPVRQQHNWNSHCFEYLKMKCFQAAVADSSCCTFRVLSNMSGKNCFWSSFQLRLSRG